MNKNTSRPSAAHALSLTFSTLALTASFGALVLGGCHKGAVTKSVSGLTPGAVALAPNQAPGSALAFIVSENSGGRATNLHLTGIRWGLLADIRDEQGITRHRDFIVDEGITSSLDYLVEINPVTEKTTITIRSPYSEAPDSPYVTKLALLEADLTVLEDKSLEPSEIPPYPLVPRNATLVLEFDDLLDPATINPQTIKILSGYPPTSAFDARIVADSNHGDLADFDGLPGLEYYATRVIVDTTVSALEAGTTNPPLPVNSVGLPASLTVGQPNIVVRIPTQLNAEVGQSLLLANPTHHTLASTGNGSIEFESPTRDIVRALRSGGGTVGDVNNGFLLDVIPPSVLGTQAVFVQNLAPGPTPETFVCDLNYALPVCAGGLTAGDVIQQGGVFGEVICPPFQTCPPDSLVTGTVSQVSGLLSTVYFRIIATATLGGPQEIEVGPAQLSTRYTSNVAPSNARCFVRFPTMTLPPDQGVSPSSSVIVRFTEPMDPVSLKPFDTLMVLRRDPTPAPPALPVTLSPYDFVVGAIGGSADSREFTFTPSLPLTHTPPATEPYWVRVLDGATGAKDLAGNALATTFPSVLFRLQSLATLENTSGFALRFTSSDELAGVGGDASTAGVGKREFRGQLLINTESQVLLPRPVTHFTANVDRFQPAPGFMTPSVTGTQTPLSKLGSKMQTLWRYFDAGLALQDEANFNIDIEGLSWAPVGSAVVADNFTRFEMSLSHCLRLPDETYDPIAMQAVFPNSGIVAQYSLNLLSGAADPLRTVYPILGGPSGYAVIPTDIFQSASGTKFMPWPLNRGIPTRNFAFYTWRDTAIVTLGGPGSTGANPLIWYQVNGLPPPMTMPPPPGVPMFNPIFPPGAIPSFGMPLLMEFRCYPDDDALGLNVFDVSMANPAPVPLPNFRAFSTGGVNTQNQIVRKDPDVQTVATGGFNPASTPLPGVATPPLDNTFYMGQMNLVTRVSRVQSIWLDSTSSTVIYSAPVVEPRPNEQPAGTSVVIEYRGATQITAASPLLLDSIFIDAYGNPRDPLFVHPGPPVNNPPAPPLFLNNDTTWKASLTQLNGARFFQLRITFISNAETNLSPGVSSLGFAYRR